VVCLKSSVNGTRKQTKQKIQTNFIGLQNKRTAVIQQRVTAVLRSIPKEAFAGSFQKLYER
jgi:hypothetical protein